MSKRPLLQLHMNDLNRQETKPRPTANDDDDKQKQGSYFGPYTRDDTDIPRLAKQSALFKIRTSPHENQCFLSFEAPLSRTQALTSMGYIEKYIYESLVVLPKLTMLCYIWQFAQKSAEWLWARRCRITGSTTSAAVGQQRGTPILNAAYESVYLTFQSSVATQWGVDNEQAATQCYVNDLTRIVTRVFREQRRSGFVGKHNSFMFRGTAIPVPFIGEDPVVEIFHYGLLIDPWNHHRGVSPDGVVCINGLMVGVLEAKCGYAKLRSMYVNVKPYYYNQLMCELYICHLYWKSVLWLDFVVWSPQNFTVDTYTFNSDYYFNWYVGRENRYYFKLLLKTYAERTLLRTQERTKEIEPSDAEILLTIEKDFGKPEGLQKQLLDDEDFQQALCGIDVDDL